MRLFRCGFADLKGIDMLNLPSNPLCSEDRGPLGSYKVAGKVQMRHIFKCVQTFNLLVSDVLLLCVSLAFICHHNSFLIYGSLEQPTLANWSRVTHVSVASALIISAAFAVGGYTTFTGYTQGISMWDIEPHVSNVLLNITNVLLWSLISTF